MTLFKDGSDAVIKDALCLSALGKLYIGEDVLIHRRLSEAEIPLQLRRHPAGNDAHFYLVSTRDGVRSVLCRHCLTPKPDDAHTWAGIAALTGWHPPVPAPTDGITSNTAGGTPAGGAP